MVRTIKLNHLAKVEGHANLYLKIDNGKVTRCHLEANEGARFFEALVKGRKYSEVQEIVSRICGICSCAHTIASVQALENAFNIEISKQTKVLRELLMIGERIRSHSTHLYFLSLPDYLGYDSMLAMAKNYPKEINRALLLVQLGNHIIETIGGREIHPLSIAVGGVTRLPSKKDLELLNHKLISAKKDVQVTAELFLKLKYPDFENPSQYFSLKNDTDYAMIDGYLHSKSITFKKEDYKKYIKESIEKYATSKFALEDEKIFMTGAMSRLNNNHKFLSGDAKKILKRFDKKLPLKNPFYNNVAQAIELIHYVDRAIMLLSKLKLKKEMIPEFTVKENIGISAIEAPRGVLFHEYSIDKDGIVTYANILTPTVQNLRNIEECIKLYLPTVLNKPKDKIILEVEKVIRAYDPCFSCSTHFLRVHGL